MREEAGSRSRSRRLLASCLNVAMPVPGGPAVWPPCPAARCVQYRWDELPPLRPPVQLQVGLLLVEQLLQLGRLALAEVEVHLVRQQVAVQDVGLRREGAKVSQAAWTAITSMRL